MTPKRWFYVSACGLLGGLNLWMWWPAAMPPPQSSAPQNYAHLLELPPDAFQMPRALPVAENIHEVIRNPFHADEGSASPLKEPPPTSEPPPPAKTAEEVVREQPASPPPPPATVDGQGKKAGKPGDVPDWKLTGVLFLQQRPLASLEIGGEITITEEGGRVLEHYVVERIQLNSVRLRDSRTQVPHYLTLSGQ